MGFIEAVKACLKKYFTISGRASRSEFWFWMLSTFLGAIITQLLDVTLLHKNLNDPHAFFPITTLFQILIFLPSLAVTVRRLHDVNRRGEWVFIGLTIVGLIFPLLVWECTKGITGPNTYGQDPLIGT